MLRPANQRLCSRADLPGISIRRLAPSEEGRTLHALNHAWAGTWNFRPLTRRALERDLGGQRDGFLVAVDAVGLITETCHAQYDQHGQNVDGNPFAWIANLTIGPECRGHGLGRALLSAAIGELHKRGARSIMLGVDGGATAPLALYRSAGFVEVDRLEFWEAHYGLHGLADTATRQRMLRERAVDELA
jgi:ribosomal protein S18 acetylase RimI-like enzyme